MNKFKRSLLLFLALLLCTVGGCRQRTTKSVAQTPSPEASPQETPSSAIGKPSTGERMFFRGTIAATGGTVKIEMMLVRDGDRVTGNYYYPKVGKSIGLTGTIDKDSNLDLREQDESGKETGVFKGKWKGADKPNELEMANISGKWSKPDGTKETSFELTQQPVRLSAESARATTKLIKESNKQSHYVIDVEYPQVEGDPRFDKFNREARALINKDVAAFKTSATATENDYGTDVPEDARNSTLDCAYEIRFASDDLISIEFSASEYSRGAAHPNSYTNVLNYDVKNGKKLSLADLFNPKATYLKAISDYSIKDLKQQAKADKDTALTDDSIKSGASPRADNFKAWTITKSGLWITFDPYQVGPYAAGPQRVLIPYSALKDLIKPDGPIGSFAT